MLEDSDSGDLEDIDVIPNEEMLMVCCVLKPRKFLNVENFVVCFITFDFWMIIGNQRKGLCEENEGRYIQSSASWNHWQICWETES